MPTAEKVPRPPEASSLLQTISAFLWAVGSPVNCSVPGKTYSLQIASDSIVWRSGVGNTDVESINFNSENQAQTTTIRSDHRAGRGETPGTTWSYTRVGPDRVQVAPGGRSPFMLARCGDARAAWPINAAASACAFVVSGSFCWDGERAPRAINRSVLRRA